MGHLGRLDHTDWGELDALADVQPEAGVEQPHAIAQQHRDDVQLELIAQLGRQDLTQQRAPSGAGDVLAAAGVLASATAPRSRRS